MAVKDRSFHVVALTLRTSLRGFRFELRVFPREGIRPSEQQVWNLLAEESYERQGHLYRAYDEG